MDTIMDMLSNSIVLLVLFTVLFLVLAIVFILWFKAFSEERRYIIMEMNRSGPGGRKHWEKRLKQLYVSQIPIIGPFLCSRIK